MSNEYGVICDLKFDVGQGKFYVFGGFFIEDFLYIVLMLGGMFSFKDNGFVGYCIGGVYEILEYVLCVLLMYCLQVMYNVLGSFDFLVIVQVGNGGIV